MLLLQDENLKTLIALHHEHEELRNGSDFELVSAEKGTNLLIYKRGSFIVCFNVSSDTKTVELEKQGEVVFALGEYNLSGSKLTLNGRNAVIIKN